MWLLPPPRRSLTPARIRLPPRFLRRIPKLRRTRKHSCARNHPGPDAAEDVPTPTPPRRPPRLPRTRQTDAADTDDTTDTTTTVTPADLQSCIALLAASQLSLDADSIEPDVREETLALSDEITETEPSTLQAVVNAAVFAAPADQTDINVDVPAGNYTGTLVIPDATIVVKDASGKETNINYTNKNITLNMTDSTLTVPTDASVGVSVFGSLTIQGGTIKAADGCTATRGVQVQLGSALTLDGTTISDFTYAGPGAGVYVKGTARRGYQRPVRCCSGQKSGTAAERGQHLSVQKAPA